MFYYLIGILVAMGTLSILMYRDSRVNTSTRLTPVAFLLFSIVWPALIILAIYLAVKEITHAGTEDCTKPMGGDAGSGYRAERIMQRRLKEYFKQNMAEKCIWTQVDDCMFVFETECGQDFSLYDGYPSDNDMHFCCFCGKEIAEVVYTDTED